MSAEKTEQVMVRLTPDQYRTLKLEAERDERPMAQIVRRAIDNYLTETALTTR